MGMSPDRTPKGFTIVEMLLAAVISVMVIGGAYMVYDASQSTARADERKADLQQNARSAMDLLMAQIRLAGYLNLGSTPNRIAIGTNTLLVLRGDVRLTGGAGIADTLFAVQPGATATCAAPPCLVSGTNVFTLNSAQSIAAQSVIAFNIQSVTFTYFDQNNNVLAAPLDGVVAGAYPESAPAPSPLGGNTATRDAVRKVRVTLTAVDPSVSAGPGVGATPDQITLSADIRFRNAD